jgi:hypothetical protein
VRVEDELEALGLALDRIGLIWLDVEGYEPYALEGLARLTSRSVPIAFEFAPHRYGRETRQRLVEMLERSYTIVHSLGRRDPAAAIRTLAFRDATDDLLIL